MKFDAVQNLRNRIQKLDDGKGNPYVEGLKAQLSSLEKLKPGQHTPNPVEMSAGFRNTPTKSSPSTQLWEDKPVQGEVK